MESLPLLDRGIPKTKSMERSGQGQSGIGKGVYKPCGMTLDFDLYRQNTFHTTYEHHVSCVANKNAHAICLRSFEPQNDPLRPSHVPLEQVTL